MKHLIYIAAIALMVAACQSAPSNSQQSTDTAAADSTKKGNFLFDTTVYNFGTILEGEQISTEFKYTNTGEADIIISKIETSCGCTVPEYDKEPVKPGNRGSIRVRFDSNGKSGTQYKTIRIFSNSENDIFDLVITGEVKSEL